MITTTPPLPRSERVRLRARGFTLVEVLISAGLAGFILTAVLTTFLFLGRSGVSIQNYNDMEAQSRRSLEQFAQDARQASEVTWHSNTSVTLLVDAASITWTFVTGAGATGTLLRQTATGTQTMITGINSFTFTAYNITGAEISLANLTVANRQTKQVQISLAAERRTRTVARATNLVLSARYILRNKRVTA
jgi:Tfp pilus assembly protein PilV